MFQLFYGGQQHGPYVLDQIKSMWASGIITADALYWNETDAAWKPLIELLSETQAPGTTKMLPPADKGERVPANEKEFRAQPVPLPTDPESAHVGPDGSITQKKSKAIDRYIKIAWILAVWAALSTLVLVILGLCGIKDIVGVPTLTGFNIIDALIVSGLAYGVYKRSRICAIILFLQMLIEGISTIRLNTNITSANSAKIVICLYYWFRGILATFDHHKLVTTEHPAHPTQPASQEKSEPDAKGIPAQSDSPASLPTTPAQAEPWDSTAPRPWRRLWARCLDNMLISILLAPITFLIWSHTESYLNASLIMTLVGLIAWPLIESILLSQKGTTAGKYLLGIRVLRQDSEFISFSQAMARCFSIIWRGFLIIPNFIAYSDLKNHGSTKWDKKGGFIVSSASIARWRWFAYFFILVAAQTISQHTAANRLIAERATKMVSELFSLPTNSPASRAQQQTEETVFVDPDYKAARVAEEAQDNPAMLQRAKILVERYPNSALALRCLSDAWYYNASLEKALSAILQALEIAPNDVIGWHDLGNIRDAMKQLPEAERAYKKGLTIDSSEPLLLADLGALQIQMGKKADGLKSTSQAEAGLTERPFNNHYGETSLESVWTTIGCNYSELELDERAVDAFEKATTPDCKNAETWNSLGNVYRKLKRTEKARTAFERATKIDPTSVFAWKMLGWSLCELDRPADAVIAFKDATKLDQQSDDCWHGLGRAYLHLGRNDDAASALERATTLYRDNAYSWDDLGRAYYGLKRYEDAVKAFENATKLAADDAFVCLELGRAYLEVNKSEDARNTLERATTLEPKNSNAWYEVGRAYYGLGRLDDARTALERATSLDPKNLSAWNGLGYVYRNLNRPADAKAASDHASALGQRSP